MSGVPDYTLEDTLDFKFTTRQFSTGAPFAFASGAIEIYEDNSLTQITAAETLTLEFDGVTGLHNLRVAATAANGFENGKTYHCVVSAGTVDSVSVVGEVVQQFSIGRSAAAVDLANATDGLGALKAETALIVADTNELQTDDVPTLIATAQADLDTITGADGVVIAAAQGPVTFTGSTNEAGLTLVGAGTGPGLSATGGATGHGVAAVGGATTGDGVNATAGASGNGMDLIGVGANAGLRTAGGATGPGIHAHGGATGATPGVEFHAHSTTGDALELEVDGSGATNADLAAILADTNELQTDWANGGRLDAILDIIAADTTTDIPALIAALNDLSAADVNTQMVDVLTVDTIAELAQAAPTATPTFATAVMLLYMALRNKVDVTATLKEIHNDAGTVIAKKTLSDDGTTYSEAEMATGP